MEEKDIRETGPVGLKGLKGIRENKKVDNTSYWEKELRNIKSNTGRGYASQYYAPESINAGLIAEKVGYGDSIYDEGAVSSVEDLYNLNEIRAQKQSWLAQIGAGAAKAGVLATTTFADTILGSIAGALNVIGNALTGNTEDFTEGVNQFVDNPFSNYMQYINDKAEEVLPNYYTQYEREQPWYKNIFTSNFIGDKFLKNTGFMIGAAAGAYLTGAGAAKVLLKKNVRDAFKGAVVNAAGKELNTASDIYKAYKTGDAFMDGAKLTKDLGEAAKQLKNAEAKIKLIGSLTSAMGEGRMEAINGAEDYEELHLEQAEDAHNKYLSNIENDLFKEHPEWFSLAVQNGGLTYNLTDENGLAEYQRRVNEENTRYEQIQAQISRDKLAVGNSIFGLNVALLTASNLWQFGRFISGGFTSGRLAKNLVKGSAKEGFSVNKSAINMTRARALSSPLMEAQEEMTQAAIQEGSGNWKASKLNNDFGSFYGGKIDPEAERQASSWLGSMMTGMANTYGDVDRWEEGFIGGLTGFLGIPKINFVSNEKGKKRPKLSFDGELYQGFRDASKMQEEANSAVKYLNENINKPEFLNYYQGMIRHFSTQNDMDLALERGDKFSFLNAEHKQMVSDALMFSKAGRLDDLYQMIEEGGNISLSDVPSLREMSIDKNTGKSLFENLTDQEVVDHVKKQADLAKKTVDKYVEISDNFKTLYGKDIDENTLEELTWGMTQVDNWETRVKELTGNIRGTLQGKATEIKERFGIDINVTLDNLEDFNNAFSKDKGLAAEIDNIINDKNLSIEEGRQRIQALIKEKDLQRRQSGLKLGRDIQHIKNKAKKRRERLQKQLDSYEQSEQLELKDRKALYKKELQELSEEIAEFYEQHDHYANLKVDDLRVQAMDAFERMAEDTGNIEAAYRAAEDIIFRDVVAPLSALEKRGSTYTITDPNTGKETVVEREGALSDWEISRISMAKSRQRKESEALFSQIAALQEMLTSPEYTSMTPLEKTNVFEMLSDLIKVLAVRTKFLDTYNQLSLNPGMYQSTFINELNKVVEKKVKEEADNAYEELEKIETYKEFKEFYEKLKPELKKEIDTRIEEGDSKILNKFLKEYKKLKEAEDIIFGNTGVGGIIGTLEATNDLASAAQRISDTLDNAESFKEFKDSLYEFVKNNVSEEAKLIIRIMDTFEELLPSSKSKTKDKKSSKKVAEKETVKSNKPKKKGRTSLLDEDGGDDLEEAPEEVKSSNKKEEVPISDDLDEDEISSYEEDSDEEETDNKDEDEDESREEDDEGTVEENSSGKYGASELNTYDIVYRKLEDLDDDELQEVLEDEDSDIISNIAQELEEEISVKDIQKIAESVNTFRQLVTENKGSTEEEASLISSKAGVYNSSAVMGYELNTLKDRKKRQAVHNDYPPAKVLRALGAFTYVDEGRLGKLLQEDKDLPIYYITAPSIKGVERAVLLAIRDDGNIDSINSIVGSDGNKYQIVGMLGAQKGDTIVYNNIEDIKKELKKERTRTKVVNPKSSYFVSKKFVNKVSHIYSGRMVKSTEEDPEVKDRNIKEVLNGSTPKFAIFYNNSNIKTPGFSQEDNVIVPPNTNNKNPREGSLWLLSREADGKYYFKAVKIRRFNKEEYDLEEHKNSPILSKIRSDIATIVDPEESDYNRSMAKYDLATLLYFPGNAQIYFNEDVVSIKDSAGATIAENITSDSASIEEAVDKIIDILQESKLNLRFQISVKNLEKESYVDDLLNSDIITTDIAILHNVNADFDMPLLDPKSGNPLSSTPEDITGHTGSRGVNNTLSANTIKLNGQTIKVYNDGSIYIEETGKDPVEVTSNKKKEEIKLSMQIKEGTINPVEGSDDLYLGYYADGTEFGIVNFKVLTKKQLKKAKEEAASIAEKEARESAIKNSVKSMEDENSEDIEDEEYSNDDIDPYDVDNAREVDFITGEVDTEQEEKQEEGKDDTPKVPTSDDEDIDLEDEDYLYSTEGKPEKDIFNDDDTSEEELSEAVPPVKTDRTEALINDFLGDQDMSYPSRPLNSEDVKTDYTPFLLEEEEKEENTPSEIPSLFEESNGVSDNSLGISATNGDAIINNEVNNILTDMILDGTTVNGVTLSGEDIVEGLKSLGIDMNNIKSKEELNSILLKIACSKKK